MIFVRTKNSTTELAEKLEARGFASAAINGDMNQAMRERVINRFKDGQLDIIVATDVAARGIDVPRVSHVINYDIPYDNESYVHRVGRTGRAGRDGKAIMFVAPRERRLLRSIEKSIGQSISSIKLPSRAELTDIRISNFKDLIQETIESENLDFYRSLANDIISDELPADALQAALLYLAQKERPLLPSKADQKHERSPDQGDDPTIQKSGSKRETYDDGIARETYKISVGHNQGVLPKDIVGAIANEAEIDSKYIGRIQIFHEYSTVDLPEGMPPEILKSLQGIWIRSTKIKMLLYKHGQDPQENPKERSKKSKTPRSKHATQQSAPTSGKARKKKQGPSGKPGKGRKRY
jgi:ATP-dependent RNA helicase DeaD